MAMALSDRAEGRVYNIASGVGSRMIDVAADIVAMAGRGRVQHVPWPPLAQQIETGDFIADISRARRELNWQPARALGAGLEETIAHYRAALA